MSEQIEALIHRLRQVAQAYPEDVFGPVTEAERKEHGGLVSRASASMGRHFSALFTEAADALRAAQSPEPGGGVAIPPDLHPATKDAVLRFTSAMAEKLHAAEKKYGYSDGWLKEDWQEECVSQMHHHIEKGDPRDVANYCMFLWARGWSTEASAKEQANIGYVKHLAEQRDALIEKLRVAESQRVAGEPVAWRVKNAPECEGNDDYYDNAVAVNSLIGMGFECTPLYLRPLPAVPEGWVCVPKEPTALMVGAGYSKVTNDIENGSDCLYAVYKAMLSASPKAPKGGGGADIYQEMLLSAADLGRV